ncbi:hypothetical protein [Methylobacterium sp. yr596]|uniref:hypothetical protein n=1 Tax=Methylobacterium sp. yr596 TaxID=1761800 RepID=UPI0008E01265|nr:hypothetical protein [Methylobacterium sp. yr596]SFE89259.1 hypothetical protein SAMN04487844_10788 [Methylobacterium sp. yr596]
MTRTTDLAPAPARVLACVAGAASGLRRAARCMRARRIRSSGAPTTSPPADLERRDVIARELHEHTRRRIPSFPPWEDLDASDPWHAGMIRIAYKRAQVFMARQD